MDEVEPKSLADDLKQQSLETARGLAPWRAGLPWWVVLVEGGVLGLVGILILIDPRKATLNVALFLAAALVVAGIIQIWSVLRGRAPEDIDSLIAARGAIGIYAGSLVLLLFFLQFLGEEAGLIAFGLGSLIYGLLGLWASIASRARRRISSIVEGLFFTLFGGLLIYVLYAGVEQVQQAIQIVGWSAIAGGVILAGLSFYNRSRDADREQQDLTAVAAPAKRDKAADKPDTGPAAETPQDEPGDEPSRFAAAQGPAQDVGEALAGDARETKKPDTPTGP